MVDAERSVLPPVLGARVHLTGGESYRDGYVGARFAIEPPVLVVLLGKILNLPNNLKHQRACGSRNRLDALTGLTVFH